MVGRDAALQGEREPVLELPAGVFRSWLRLLTNLHDQETIEQLTTILGQELANLTGARVIALFRSRAGAAPESQPLVGPSVSFPESLAGMEVGLVWSEGALTGAVLYEDWRVKVWLVLIGAERDDVHPMLREVAAELGEILHRVEEIEALRSSALLNLDRVRSARQKLLGAFRDSLRALADRHATREDVLWEVLRGVHLVSQGAVTLLAMQQPAAFRILALDRAQQRLAAACKDLELQKTLENALGSRRGLPLRGQRAQLLCELLVQPSRLDWFYLLPVRAGDYFRGLVGVGMPSLHWPLAKDSVASLTPRQLPTLMSSSAHSVGQARWEAVSLLRAISEDVADFLERNSIREAAYGAGAAQEGAQIGMNIHDSALQDLSYVRLQLEALRLEIESRGEEPPASVREVMDTVSRISRDMRQLSVMLTSVDQLADPISAIQETAEKFRSRMEAEIELRIEGDRRDLGYRVSSQIVRIVQEALNNVWKHAGATRIEVILTYLDESLQLLVVDNGRGFETDRPTPGSLGLRGMERRVNELGGSITISSQPGQGTAIRVEVPA